MDRGACWATVHGAAESDVLEPLNTHFLEAILSNTRLSGQSRSSLCCRAQCGMGVGGRKSSQLVLGINESRGVSIGCWGNLGVGRAGGKERY